MNYHRQLKEFYEATVDAFDHHSLDRLVYFELTVRLKDVTNFGSNFKDVVFELITWAVSEGILEKLVMVIKAGCPDNPNLQVTANRLLEALPDGPPLLTLSLGSIANWLEEAGPLETQLAFDEFCNKIAIDAIPSSLFPPECSAKDRASALVNHLYHDGNYAAFLKLCNFIRKQVSAASNLKEILDTIAQEDVTENFRIAMRAAGWVDDSFILKAEGPPRPLRILPKFGITYPRRALDVGWRWGLQRGPFCGLISSPPDLSVLKHLREVERTLWDARQFDAKPSLPIRWWVQLDSTKKLSGSLSLMNFGAASTKPIETQSRFAIRSYLRFLGSFLAEIVDLSMRLLSRVGLT